MKAVSRQVVSDILSAILFAFCSSAEAQPINAVYRISCGESFGQHGPCGGIPASLQELVGYLEGKNIVIAWRYAEGKRERLPALQRR